MTTALDRWLRRHRWQPPPAVRGALVKFERRTGLVMSRPAYTVRMAGHDMYIGKVEFRNQWNHYAFYPDPECMYNKAILAEIYAMLRDLDRGMLLDTVT